MLKSSSSSVNQTHRLTAENYRDVCIYEVFRGDKFEKNKLGGACSAYGERRGVYEVLVGKPKEKIQLGRPRRRWENNTKRDLQEVKCRSMD